MIRLTRKETTEAEIKIENIIYFLVVLYLTMTKLFMIIEKYTRIRA